MMPVEQDAFSACTRGERIISEAEYRKLQLWREAAENVNGNFFDILLEAQTEKVSAA